MDKAEERALERFPTYEGASKQWIQLYLNYDPCKSYIEGYHQAEKDLALTWEDMMLISGIMEDLLNSKESVDMDEVEYWTETLKRFNEERSKK